MVMEMWILLLISIIYKMRVMITIIIRLTTIIMMMIIG
jgi:hypothetical protein